MFLRFDASGVEINMELIPSGLDYLRSSIVPEAFLVFAPVSCAHHHVVNMHPVYAELSEFFGRYFRMSVSEYVENLVHIRSQLNHLLVRRVLWHECNCSGSISHYEIVVISGGEIVCEKLCKVDILSSDEVILRFLGYGHSDDISIGSNGKLREGGVGVRWSS